MLPIKGLATETDQPSPVETCKSYICHNQETNYHITLVTWNIVNNERLKVPVRKWTMSKNNFLGCWSWLHQGEIKHGTQKSKQHLTCTEVPAIDAAEEMNSKDSGDTCHKYQDDNCWNDGDHGWKKHFSQLRCIIQMLSSWDSRIDISLNQRNCMNSMGGTE